MVSTLITISIIAIAVFVTIAALVSRYKRCPSDKVLVVYGKVGKSESGRSTSRCIHGGAAFIWPVIQDFAFMDLKPMAIDVNLQNALSKQNIRLNVPSTYTVAINTDEKVVTNAAERLLGLERQEIAQLAKDIILGQMRLVIATMGIEEINTDRDQFLSKIQENVESELSKIGLKLINANIVDIQDESGYIDALGKEAAAKAINDAKVSVAEKNRDGAIGEADANQAKRTKVAELTTKAEIGEAQALQEKRIKLSENDAAAIAGEAEAQARAFAAQAEANAKAEAAKAEANAKQAIAKATAESTSRQKTAELDANAVKGENLAQVQIAESSSDRKVKEAEANRKAITAQKVKEAEALKDSYKAQEEAEKARAEKDKATQFADVIVKAEIEKGRIELAAEAEAEKERRIAKGKADAKFAEMEAEAKGNYERLAKQAEGIQKLVNAAGGDPDKAIQLLIADKIESLYKIQVEAIKNVKIDKITVWDQGSGSGNGSTTSDFLRSMLNIVPGFDEVYKMAGKELPSMLQGAGEKSKAAIKGENEAKAEIAENKKSDNKA